MEERLVHGDSKARTITKRPQKAQCLFLSMLPLEMRIQIYRLLLVKDSQLDRAGEWVRNKENMQKSIIFKESTQERQDLHASMLRTCRTIYTEALLILYSENGFKFTTPADLCTFRENGLARIRSTNDPSTFVPSFNLQVAPDGRFTMVKTLFLYLKLSQYKGMNPNAVRKWQETAVNFWGRFLLQDKIEGGNKYISFPALEVLLLDFEDWKLDVDDALVTGPFILKFRGSAGVREATIKGVKNKRTLREFEQGLLRDGGRFIAIDSDDGQ